MVGGDATAWHTQRRTLLAPASHDMVRRGKISLVETRLFVLDEADQMAKDKESEQRCANCTVRAVQNRAPDSKISRLQVCFSQRFTAKRRSLAEEITQHATWVDLKGKDVVPETVHHVIVPVTTQSVAAPGGSRSLLDMFTDGVHARDDPGCPARRQGASKEAKSQIVKRLKLKSWKRSSTRFAWTCMIFVARIDCEWVGAHLNSLVVRRWTRWRIPR